MPENSEINLTASEDMMKLQAVLPQLTDNDFKPLPDDGNVLVLPIDGFENLAAEGPGAQVMLIVKGRIGEVGNDIVIDAFDAALVHGANNMKAPAGEQKFDRLKAALSGKKNKSSKPIKYGPKGKGY